MVELTHYREKSSVPVRNTQLCCEYRTADGIQLRDVVGGLLAVVVAFVLAYSALKTWDWLAPPLIILAFYFIWQWMRKAQSQHIRFDVAEGVLTVHSRMVKNTIQLPIEQITNVKLVRADYEVVKLPVITAESYGIQQRQPVESMSVVYIAFEVEHNGQVVLKDVLMPKMEGDEVVAKLRRFLRAQNWIPSSER